MEGCNLDLPSNDQIPYRLWSRRATRRSDGYTRMLRSYDGDGRSSPGHDGLKNTGQFAECFSANPSLIEIRAECFSAEFSNSAQAH